MVHILDENDIQSNYTKFRTLIENTFDGGRLASLNKMYDELEDRIVLTPASSYSHFHNAFAGGYIEHILRVTRNAVKFYELYTELGLDTSDYNKETVIFTALHHDLGKVGNHEQNWYIPNDSQWHVENQGKVYKTNPSMHHMNLNDRTFWLLNHYGIQITEIEYLGIKLTDGLFDDANKEYYMKFADESSLKTNLPLVMHHADVVAARFEKERWSKLKEESNKPKNLGGRPTKNQKLKDIKMPDKIDFKSIFGEEN